MHRMNIFQRREAPGDGGGGGGGGGTPAWYEGIEGVKDNPQLVERVKGFKSPVEALSAINLGFGPQWREEMVGQLPEAERADAMTWAQRYKSPKDFFDGARQAHSKARENAALRAPGDKATPEEIKAYRTAMGVPEKPGEYLDGLPNGLVIGEDDKPAMEFFFGEDFHKLNVPKAVAHQLIGRYNQFQDKITQDRQAADGEDKTAAEDALRTDFGNDYRANMNVLRTYVEGLPEGVGEILSQARGADGVALMNNPAVVKALVGIAREINPGATLMGGAGGAGGAPDIDAEIAAIEKTMRTNRKEYDKDPKMKKRFEDLLDARGRRDARKTGTKAA